MLTFSPLLLHKFFGFVELLWQLSLHALREVHRSVYMGKVSVDIFNNGEKEVFGEKLRGSLNNNLWVSQLSKSLKLEKKESKTKFRVALSVIATENDKEIGFISIGIAGWPDMRLPSFILYPRRTELTVRRLLGPVLILASGYLVVIKRSGLLVELFFWR